MRRAYRIGLGVGLGLTVALVFPAIVTAIVGGSAESSWLTGVSAVMGLMFGGWLAWPIIAVGHVSRPPRT